MPYMGPYAKLKFNREPFWHKDCLMNYEEKSDMEWVWKVQAGETDAFEVLIRRREKKIFNLIYRWLGNHDDAAEVAQEVFLSAYRAIRKFRGESSFSTWLYKIAINHAKNRRKSMAILQQRTVPLEVSDPEGNGGPIASLFHQGPDPGQEAEQQEIHERVHLELNCLDPDDGLLILLHDLQNVSYEEMSQILSIPVGTVRSRLHRARQALKARLAPYFYSKEAHK